MPQLISLQSLTNENGGNIGSVSVTKVSDNHFVIVGNEYACGFIQVKCVGLYRSMNLAGKVAGHLLLGGVQQAGTEILGSSLTLWN